VSGEQTDQGVVADPDYDDLREGLGDPHLTAQAIDELRKIIIATGALDEVEFLISERTDQALAALAAAELDADARTALSELAVAATARSL